MFTGEKVRLLRQARGLKQKEMARRMKVCQQRLSAIENSHEVNDGQIKKILTILMFTAEEAWRFLENLPPPPAIIRMHDKKSNWDYILF